MSRHGQMPGQNCPYCNEFVDTASGVDDDNARPEEGNICICIHCGEIAQFDDKEILHKITEDTLLQLSAEHGDAMNEAFEVSNKIKKARKNISNYHSEK